MTGKQRRSEKEKESNPAAGPGLTEQGRKRLTTVIILSIVVMLLLLLLIAQSGFNLSPLVMPDTAGETLLFYALSSLNFLAFVTLLFVLLRNVLKLVRERRARRLGSKFKARLVSFAIGLSLLPVLLLFFFAYGLLNRSIDRWFGEPARQVVDDAQAIKDSYFDKEEDELLNIARTVSTKLSLASLEDYRSPELEERLRHQIAAYNVSLARLIAPKERVTIQSREREVEPEIEETLEAAEQQMLAGDPIFTGTDEGDSPQVIYIVAAVKLSDAQGEGRLLILARQLPPELTQRAANITAQHAAFYSLKGKIKRIKSMYILLLAAVTLLLIFAASWLALYVARGITVPIQALVEATDHVAHGDFEHRVETVAEDELAALVSSFNQMARQLAENRERLERAAADLRSTNLELDNRRLYIETVLETLSTGVISTDENAGIATINRAAQFMLALGDKPAVGTPINRVIAGQQGEELAKLCRRARRSETAQAEIQYDRKDGSTLHTATTAIALRDSEGGFGGWVIVIEDLTDLIQAERAAAWGEVARRMAHEIKNPLTPIQLSAERIIRNYHRTDGVQSQVPFDRIVNEGTATIVREVAALQRMVEEFSRFARLPEARLTEASLNDVVSDAVRLYDERLNGIGIECKLAEDLPKLRLDCEQIKRVLVNLIDNALEALNSNSNPANGANRRASGAGGKRIRIESEYLPGTDMVRLTLSDTGHGISPADRDKLFLPKFSTRNRGTGLGLAIVSHIIADHKGRIWVEENKPRGARFIIELPVQ